MNELPMNDEMNKDNHESGFTLIEVLVASAIIMASIGVLMQLFASGLDRTQRAGKMAHLLTAQRVIVHELEVTNPAIQKSGKGVAEGLSYHWKASVSEPMRYVYDADGEHYRQVGLFEIQVTVMSVSGKSRVFFFDQIGWKNSL